MESLPKIFTGQAPTKSEIQEGANKVISIVVDDGEICPLKVATSLKAMETAIKIIKDGIHEAVMDEAAKESGKTFDRGGHSYNLRSYARYDYSDCGDPVLERLSDKAEELTNDRKDRESFLKALKSSLNVIDEETGEVVEVFPPSKSGKDIIAITLAK